MQDNEPPSTPLPNLPSTVDPPSSDLHASFIALPGKVQRMMKELGVTTPEELRSTAGFMDFIEQNLDPAVLDAISDAKSDSLSIMSAIRGCLSTRSVEALAVHLYTRELLSLITIAAARQYAASIPRRSERSREKQLLLTARRYMSRRSLI